MESEQDDRVSRARYLRERTARKEAEQLLEAKSRELFLANQKLSQHSEVLEQAIIERTSDLRSALQKAEEASAMRARFIATMSHEIRTPLGGLLGMIDLMHGDETDPAKLELLEYARASGNALKRIVNDVLDFSKLEAGAFQFENERVDIRALISSVIALASASIPDGKNRLHSSISSTVPRCFAGDATRIRQVVSNLISNAGRYSTEGAIEIRAFAIPHEKGAMLRVEVEDQGIGIPEAQQKDLFKDFTQVQNELTAAAQGTGLGLAISRRIIEGAGGEIGVSSVAGVGSTFWFELPVEVLEAPIAEAPAKVSVAKADINGARILLAEDNKINQKLLLTFLKRMNVSAELAENGRVAVEMFAPGKYDLILMDVAMPEMDGLEATRVIRERWPAAQVPPIMLLTAHVMDAIQEDSARVGIERVLSKPITYGDLHEAIAEQLGTDGGAEDAAPKTFAARPAVFVHLAEPILKGLSETMEEHEVVEVVTEYVTEARQILEVIATEFASGDVQAAAAMAHALKGVSGLIGVLEIAEYAGRIELNAPNMDEKSVRDAISTISKHVDKIDAALNSPPG